MNHILKYLIFGTVVAGVSPVMAGDKQQPAGGELIGGNQLENFRTTTGWSMAGGVTAVAGATELSIIKKKSGGGSVLVNGARRNDKIPYLFTKEEFSDVIIHLDFMIPKNSDSGVYLMGRYEVQILDSYGKDVVKFNDLGAIYPRWDAKRSPNEYEGKAPMANATKAPGEWQSLDIVFRAPRFNAAGEKTENARFISVHVNGRLVQENVEVSGGTHSHPLKGEAAQGPILIQGRHGPIAIRSFIVKPFKSTASKAVPVE